MGYVKANILLEMKNIKKSFGEETLFSFPEFTVYERERIGLIGINGSGKSTLLRLICGEVEADRGTVERYGTISYFSQFGERQNTAEVQWLKKLRVKEKVSQVQVSGGEQMRIRLAETFSRRLHLLLLDEPTANLDLEGIELLKKKLEEYPSFILISHDIGLLNQLCTRIVEISEHTLFSYPGNYEDYVTQKNLLVQTKEKEYEEYQQEKSRLENVFCEKSRKAKSLAKKPAKVSNSEYKMRNYAKLSRSNEGKEKSMEKAAKAVQTRLEQLAVKEQPEKRERMQMDFSLTDPPKNRIVISAEALNFAYGEHCIFKDAKFFIANRSKTAVIGKNGSGKTTLLKLIKEQYEGIYTVPKAKIGMLYQNFENIQISETVLGAVRKDSIQREHINRKVLDKLLFSEKDFSKPVNVLSGGEKIRLSLAKLLVSDVNILILDEPANYLDVPSVEVLTEVLQEYEGTVVFVSHDSWFAGQIATDILHVKNNSITTFHGKLDQYQKRNKNNNRSVLKSLAEIKELRGE